MSPGPPRSPTDISLGELAHISSNDDVGEGTSRSAASVPSDQQVTDRDPQDLSAPPPEYTSPMGSMDSSRRSSEGSDSDGGGGEEGSLIRPGTRRPPIPSYDAATANDLRSRER